MKLFTLVLASGLGLGLTAMAGCATGRAERDADTLALYRAHAGAPVNKFHYFGSLNSWTPLDDDVIAVWTRPSEAWLLQLSGPCPEIESTPAITLTSTFGQVSVRFDKVIVHSRSAVNLPCHISQIQPLDVKAIRQARRDGAGGGTGPNAGPGAT